MAKLLSGTRIYGTANVDTQINVGANAVVNTSAYFIGNSTVNTVITATGFTTNNVNANTIVANSALFNVGANVGSNVQLTTSQLFIGNASVNTTITSSSFVSQGTIATGNATHTGFLNVSSTANVGGLLNARSDLVVNGALTVSNTAALGNTTITGWANVSGNITANNIRTLGNLQIDGDFTVSGNTITIGVTNLAISDNIIYLNEPETVTIASATSNGTAFIYTANNGYSVGEVVTVTGITPSGYNIAANTITAANSTTFAVANTTAPGTYVSGGSAVARVDTNPDIGFAANYNDGTYRHAGFFRDATDGVFKVFDQYVPEPSGAFIDTSNNTFRIAGFQANATTLGTLTTGNTTITGFINVSSTATVNGALTVNNTASVGNTTITGFANISSTANIGGVLTARSDVTVNGALTVSNTAALGNTTLTGFINATASVNSAIISVGTNFIANSTGVTTTGFINVSSTANVGGAITARSDVTVNGALTVANTASLGNTTITGFANITGVTTASSNVNIVGANLYFTGTSSVGNYLVFAANTPGSHGFVKPSSNTTVSQRFDFYNAGSNNAANPFWGGYHFTAPDGAFTNSTAGTGYPRVSLYHSYTSNANPTDLYFNIVPGNGPVGVGHGVKIYALGADTNLRGIDVAANGNIGIGNSAPADKLSVFGTVAVTNSTANVFNVAANGNVGIGYNSPNFKLRVAGTIVGDANDNYFGTMSGDYVDIGNLGATGSVYFDARGASSNVNIQIRAKGTADHVFLNQGGSTEVVRFAANGNVGIGTASPSVALTVAAASTNGSITTAAFTNPNTGTGSQAVMIWGAGASQSQAIQGQSYFEFKTMSMVPQLYFSTTNATSGSIIFRPGNATTAMYLAANGNIGMGGNTVPTDALAVTGSFAVANTTQTGFTVAGNGTTTIGYGGTFTGTSLTVRKDITGGTTALGMYQFGAVQSDVTTAYGIRNNLVTQAGAATAWTLGAYTHFHANETSIGANSTVTSQYGFRASSSFGGATYNYGFTGEVSAGANKYNLYMSGTANNILYGITQFANNVFIGGTGLGNSYALATGLTIRAPTSTVNQEDVVFRIESSPATGTQDRLIEFVQATGATDGLTRGVLRIGNEFTNGSAPSIIQLHAGGDSWINSSNVGIGNATPNAKLQVTGTANVSGTATFGGDFIVTGNNGSGANITFAANATTGDFKIYRDSPQAGAGNLSQYLSITEGPSGHTITGYSTVTNQKSIIINAVTGNTAYDYGIALQLDTATKFYANATTVRSFVDFQSTNGNTSLGNTTITGNLTVTGTTTYVNTTNLNVGDNVITLNADVTSGQAPTENMGLEFNRGSSANVTFLWDETNGQFKFTGQSAATGTLLTINNAYGECNKDLVFTYNDTAPVARIRAYGRPATPSAGQNMSFWLDDGTAQPSSNLQQRMTLVSNGNFGIGNTAPTSALVIERNVDSNNPTVLVRNTTTGTGALTTVRVTGDTVGSQLDIGVASNTYGGYGLIGANSAFILSKSVNGLGIFADNAASYLRFGAGGTSEYMRLNANGGLYVGTTGDLYGRQWQGIYNKNQNGTTQLGVINSNTGASAEARFSMITGTGNSFMDWGLKDNAGAPTSIMNFGTAVSSLSVVVSNTSGSFKVANATATALHVSTANGNVGIGNVTPAQTLVVVGTANVSGNLAHGGLVMTTGTNVDQIYTATPSLTLNTTWQSTGVTSTNLANGTYVVQLLANDVAAGGTANNEYYSGMMSWYSADTNSTILDEIPLHRAGVNGSNNSIFLATQRTATANTSDLILMISSAANNSSSSTYTLKFRRMI